MVFFDRLNSKRYAAFNYEINCAINNLKTVKPESVTLSDMLCKARGYYKDLKIEAESNGFFRKVSGVAYTADVVRKKQGNHHPRVKKCHACNQSGRMKIECRIWKKFLEKNGGLVKTESGKESRTKVQNKADFNYLVVLDTGATKSILQPAALTDLRSTASTYTIHGIGDETFSINLDGMYDKLHRVLAKNKARANILCFLELQDAGGEFLYFKGKKFKYTKEGHV